MHIGTVCVEESGTTSMRESPSVSHQLAAYGGSQSNVGDLVIHCTGQNLMCWSTCSLAPDLSPGAGGAHRSQSACLGRQRRSRGRSSVAHFDGSLRQGARLPGKSPRPGAGAIGIARPRVRHRVTPLTCARLSQWNKMLSCATTAQFDILWFYVPPPTGPSGSAILGHNPGFLRSMVRTSTFRNKK